MKRRLRIDIDAEPAMDPMVDVVFLLLVFFIFTFQVKVLEILVPVEPVTARSLAKSEETPPLPVHLEATANGRLAAIRIGSESTDSLASLLECLERAAEKRPQAERRASLWPSPRLKYDVVIEALRLMQAAGWHVQLGSTQEEKTG